MSGILGHTFILGPEVLPPVTYGWTMSYAKVMNARYAWQAAIEDAVRYEDAWGLLCTAPDMDVTLRDVLTPGAVWAATKASRVHLLLAREAR